MKIARLIGKNRISGALAAALALVFVLSLSVHNHYFSFGGGGRISQSGEHYGHSAESCSACRLQGNIELPDRDVSPVYVISLTYIVYESSEPLVPASYLSLEKPTRSPPSA